MKSIWQSSLLLLAGEVAAEVFQVPLLHYESEQYGPRSLMMNLQVGSPAQNIRALADTGSTDLVILQKNSALCAKQPQVCNEFGVDTSGGVSVTNQTVTADYAGGDGYSGQMATAPINMPREAAAMGPTFAQSAQSVGAPVPGVQFALAQTRSPRSDLTVPSLAILGLGPQESEQTNQKYPTLMENFKKNQKIKSNVVSIVAPVEPNRMGSMIMGGLDKAKFTGPLQKVALEPDPKSGKVEEIIVKLSSVKLEMGGAPATVPQKRDLQRKEMRTKAKGWKRRGRGRLVKRKNRGHWGGGYSKVQERANGQQGGGGGGNGQQGGGAATNAAAGTIDLNIGNTNLIILDTGGVDDSLSESSIKTLSTTLGAEFNTTDGSIGLVDCNKLEGKTLVYGFNNDQATCRIPLSYFKESNSFLEPAEKQSGKCRLVLYANDPKEPINFGSLNWFAGCHTTIDLDSKVVYIAQAAGDPGAPSLPQNLVEL